MLATGRRQHPAVLIWLVAHLPPFFFPLFSLPLLHVSRIFKTPIPLIYSRHTSRFLLCWLTILPFCTAGQVGWVTVPIACGMAFFLLGIEVRGGGAPASSAARVSMFSTVVRDTRSWMPVTAAGTHPNACKCA